MALVGGATVVASATVTHRRCAHDSSDSSASAPVYINTEKHCWKKIKGEGGKGWWHMRVLMTRTHKARSRRGRLPRFVDLLPSEKCAGADVASSMAFHAMDSPVGARSPPMSTCKKKKNCTWHEMDTSE